MSLLPEIFFILLMFGSVVAIIVASMKEKKAKAAAARMMQPVPMAMENNSDGFGDAGGDGFEFNVDSFK